MSSLEEAISWFKSQFGDAVQATFAGTPFTLDLLTAIAIQETYGDIWGPLFKRLPASEVLKLCVGDTIDWPSRRAFPRTKADLLQAPQGNGMFQVARTALEDIAPYNTAYGKVARSKSGQVLPWFRYFPIRYPALQN